jgi:hypothetical protein
VSSLANTFRRVTTLVASSFETRPSGWSTPSIRQEMARPLAVGKMCRSLAPAATDAASKASTIATAACGSSARVDWSR